MAQNVTTAYELLEKRLDVSVRLLGVVLFLGVRVLWMGFIVFVTSREIIVPLAGLPPESTTLVSIVVGAITVIYTSMGGLRAVVITDVVQAAILLGGAVLTLVVISTALGGVHAWWPEEWPKHWQQPAFGLRTDVRISMLPAMLTGFLWWICTASSDQIAIQRYLATENARSARRALGISLLTAAITIALLSLVGLALLAYFKAHPDNLNSGQTIANHADQLFQRFIVIGFPAGVTGLVISALLAAAMSSLSSGINSACSVITVDLVDRFKGKATSEAAHIRRTKAISYAVGGMIVAFSISAEHTDGNLFEASTTVVNLLVAPLFLLFFMAIVIPWSTVLGTWIAALSSTITAIGIAYFDWWQMNFIWIIPVSLAIGIIIGPLASAIENMVLRTLRSVDP